MTSERILIAVDEAMVERLEVALDRLDDFVQRAEAMATSPPSLSYREAAHVLGISERKVQAMAAAGEIEVRRFGTRVVIARSEIDRLLGQGTGVDA